MVALIFKIKCNFKAEVKSKHISHDGNKTEMCCSGFSEYTDVYVCVCVGGGERKEVLGYNLFHVYSK